LLCTRCTKLVASMRHVRKHVRAFEAWFKKWGLTVQLGRLHEVMRIWGMSPAHDETGSAPRAI
jgi:hypothetical protein